MRRAREYDRPEAAWIGIEFVYAFETYRVVRLKFRARLLPVVAVSLRDGHEELFSVEDIRWALKYARV